MKITQNKREHNIKTPKDPTLRNYYRKRTKKVYSKAKLATLRKLMNYRTILLKIKKYANYNK